MVNAVKANKVKTKLNIHVFFFRGFRILCDNNNNYNNNKEGTVAEGKLKINLS